ncbi:MAG: carbonic anhydrase [Candidatus Eremiobacteraeota bacterium]|nr:carbonic anhydrase [Candidatus Eremiobacteraeota bacterium]
MAATTLGTVADSARASGPPGPHLGSMSGDQALERLLAGNHRYAADKVVNCNNNYSRRAEVAQSQAPFAIVLGCSDSRVPLEVVFDQRLGDLFVIRVAGNVSDDFGLASMEYAVAHFAPSLLLVVGHERCGAVSAALDAVAKRAAIPPGHLGSLVRAIMPAARSVAGQPGDALNNAVRANIEKTVRSLARSSPVIAAAASSKQLSIRGARYSLTDGLVTVVG